MLQKKAYERPCVNKGKPEADELSVCIGKDLGQMKPCLVTQYVIPKVESIEHPSYNKTN